MCRLAGTTSFGSLTSCSLDGFIDDDEFVVLYDPYASKNLDFPYNSYTPFDLEELDESESFAEFRFGKRDIRNLKEVLKIPDNKN